VLHLADVHIPFFKHQFQEHQRVRLERCAAGIDRLLCAVRAVLTPPEDAVVLIAGDLLDCRHTANASTVALLHRLVEGLCAVAPVYITAGNHDLHLEEEHENASADLLGALLQPLLSRLPVAYIDATGVYGTPGTGALFGVLQIRDAMVSGNCSGGMRDVDDMPFDLLRLDDVTSHDSHALNDSPLFVFHGSWRHHGQSQQHHHQHDVIPRLAGECGYDACLLGDVHSMQLQGGFRPVAMTYDDDCGDVVCAGEFDYERNVGDVDSGRRRRGGVPWAYSGSPSQLNAGERLFPHGFLCWHLGEERRVRAYHVPSPSGTLVVSSAADGELLLHNASALLDEPSSTPEPLPLARAIREGHLPWLPRRVTVRVIGGASAHAMVKALEEECGLTVEGSSSSASSARNGGGDIPGRSVERSESMTHTALAVDLSRYGRREAWLEYALSDRPDCSSEQRREWETWLRSPEALRLPPDLCALPCVATKCRERNGKLDKKTAEVANAGQQVDGKLGQNAADLGTARTAPTRRRRFSLLRMRWSWLLCFGADNAFDFAAFEGRVALLSAPNGRGKSSVLEIVCLALYGQPMASRGGKTSLADVVCKTGRGSAANATSANRASSCSIDVALPGGNQYRLTRTFSVHPDTRKVTATARVSRLATASALVTVKDGATAVNAWVAEHLGDLQGFLLCSMLTQHGDADFFGMRPQEQRQLLDDALALDATRALAEALKEARLAHGAILDALQAALEARRSAQDPALFPTSSGLEARRSAQDPALFPTSSGLEALRVREAELRTRMQEEDQEDGAASSDGGGDDGGDTAIEQDAREEAAWKAADWPQEWMDESSTTAEAEEERLERLERLHSRARSAGEKEALALEGHREAIAAADEEREARALAKTAYGEAREHQERGDDDDERLDEEEEEEEEDEEEKEKEKEKEAERKATRAYEEVVDRVRRAKDVAADVRRLEEELEEAERLALERGRSLREERDAWEADRSRAIETASSDRLLSDDDEQIGDRDGDSIAAKISARLAASTAAPAYATGCWACERRRVQLNHAKPYDSPEVRESASAWAEHWKRASLGGATKRRAKWDEERMAERRSMTALASKRERLAQEQERASELSAAAREARSTYSRVCEELEEVRRDMQSERTTSTSKTKKVQTAQQQKKERALRLARVDEALRAIERAESKLGRREAEVSKAAEKYGSSKERAAETRAEAERYAAFCRAWPAYLELSRRLSERRRAAETRRSELRARRDRRERRGRLVLELDRAQTALAAFEAFAREEERLVEASRALEGRRDSIVGLASKMDSYFSWVYEARALPELVAEVNALLRSMSVAHALEASTSEKHELVWSMGDMPLTKCSGMQRFALSLAMRLALARLGACNVACEQLVIDEGFAALDAQNIAAVPDFLHEGVLGAGRFSSVLLVSHLEGVREAADLVISIGRDEGDLSVLRC